MNLTINADIEVNGTNSVEVDDVAGVLAFDANASLSVRGTTVSEDKSEMLGVFDLTSQTGITQVGVPGSIAANKVALYAGIEGLAGTGNIWAFNTVNVMREGSGTDYYAQGYELDFVNLVAHRGEADGEAGTDTSVPFSIGLNITSTSTLNFRNTAAIMVFGGGTGLWNRGICFRPGSVTQAAFQDLSNSATSIDIIGSHTMGIRVRGTTTYDAIFNGTGGKVGIGTNAPGAQLEIEGGVSADQLRIGHSDSDATHIYKIGRQVSTGHLLFRGDQTDPGTVGYDFTGSMRITLSGATPLTVDRLLNDGVMVQWQRNTANIGDISVAAGTVTYGPFCGSHPSSMSDGKHPEILVGTVVETVDDIHDRHLPKFKISDTNGSPNVYGVFMAWNDAGGATIASLGAFQIRIGKGVKVQMGDLLQSAGDGTAEPQGDDIMRAKTIAKVTGTTHLIDYPDGSYTVPATLHCG
jgi:hypothetical protein